MTEMDEGDIVVLRANTGWKYPSLDLWKQNIYKRPGSNHALHTTIPQRRGPLPLPNTAAALYQNSPNYSLPLKGGYLSVT